MPDADRKEIWVGSNGERKVVIFNAKNLVKRGEFRVDGVPIRVEHSPNGRFVAVSLADRDAVVIYDARERTKVTGIDLQPHGATTPVTMLWSPDGSKLWVAGTGSQTVAEIDTNRWIVERSFKAGAGSDGLGFSPMTTDNPGCT